jgi:hypothetical protein
MTLARHNISALRENLNQARGHWRLGRRYGYPRCCVAHFCWDTAMGVSAGQARASQIEHPPAKEWPYVYCGIFHSGESSLSLPERLSRILGSQWSLLKPTGSSHIFTAQMGYGLFRQHRRGWSSEFEFARWSSHEDEQAVWFDDGGLDPELEWR